jgi:hypothetical protein
VSEIEMIVVWMQKTAVGFWNFYIGFGGCGEINGLGMF